jgi:hypothetical protein
MAATALSALQTPAVWNAYLSAYLQGNLTFVRSGVFDLSLNLDQEKGNTWNVPMYEEFSFDWEAPTANTAVTVNALTTHKETGVICRRVYGVGNEVLNNNVIGDDPMAEIVRQIGHYSLKKTESVIGASLLPGLFNSTNGVLYATHAKSGVIGSDLVKQADEVMSERIDALSAIIMHPDVYNHLNKMGFVSEIEPLSAEVMRSGGWTGNSAFGKFIIVNPRISTKSGGTYLVYVAGRNAFKLNFDPTIPPYELTTSHAGRTDAMYINWRFAPHIGGTSYTGSAPTAIAGASDANLSTGTNWTKVAVNDEEIPLVQLICTLS